MSSRISLGKVDSAEGLNRSIILDLIRITITEGLYGGYWEIQGEQNVGDIPLAYFRVVCIGSTV